MSSESKQRELVTIEKKWHQLYKDLSEGKDAPFTTMKDVFLMAAVIGHNKRRRKQLGSSRERPFRWSQLQTDTDVPLIRALAIAEEGDIEILSDMDRILTIAEEYANEGIVDLEAQVANQPGEPLMNMVGLINNMVTSSAE